MTRSTSEVTHSLANWVKMDRGSIPGANFFSVRTQAASSSLEGVSMITDTPSSVASYWEGELMTNNTTLCIDMCQWCAER